MRQKLVEWNAGLSKDATESADSQLGMERHNTADFSLLRPLLQDCMATFLALVQSS